MKTNIDILKNKMVNLEDFFRCAAKMLKKEMKFDHSYFMVPDNKKGDFATKYSTFDHHIHFTKREVSAFIGRDNNDIYYNRRLFLSSDLFKNISLVKLTWKMMWHGISAIMPIISEGKIICLILLAGTYSNNKFDKNASNINYLRREITRYLEEILLYNQALKRIISSYDNINKCPTIRSPRLVDNQGLALIGKKMEYL